MSRISQKQSARAGDIVCDDAAVGAARIGLA